MRNPFYSSYVLFTFPTNAFIHWKIPPDDHFKQYTADVLGVNWLPALSFIYQLFSTSNLRNIHFQTLFSVRVATLSDLITQNVFTFVFIACYLRTESRILQTPGRWAQRAEWLDPAVSPGRWTNTETGFLGHRRTPVGRPGRRDEARAEWPRESAARLWRNGWLKPATNRLSIKQESTTVHRLPAVVSIWSEGWVLSYLVPWPLAFKALWA